MKIFLLILGCVILFLTIAYLVLFTLIRIIDLEIEYVHRKTGKKIKPKYTKTK